jgi:phosphoribosylglycinamide formyltransferase-1
MPEPLRVAILISGRGSNMTALVDGMRSGAVPAHPALVVSNVPDAPGLAAAAERGVETVVVDHRVHRPRAVHDALLVEVLRRHRIDLVCLAGYMRLVGPSMVDAFRGRMLNVHPSLLPSFPGLHAQRQAIEHGVKVAGCTVHFVDEECDHGPIVIQAAVAVREDDDEDALSARILDEEHRIYAEAVRWFCQGRLSIRGRTVHVAPA